MWRVFGGERVTMSVGPCCIGGSSPKHEIDQHQVTLNTFITSSPRWLITFTAMRPDLGLSKGREVSLLSVAHASTSISAFSMVFSALYGSLAPRK